MFHLVWYYNLTGVFCISSYNPTLMLVIRNNAVKYTVHLKYCLPQLLKKEKVFPWSGLLICIKRARQYIQISVYI